MLFKTFTATGTSRAFTAIGSFDVILSMTGTNSLTLEREVVKGTWVTFGSAVTAAGTIHKSKGTDFADVTRFRLNLGTKDSGDVVAYLEGAILADELSSVTGDDSYLLESGDDYLTENEEYLEMENA